MNPNQVTNSQPIINNTESPSLPSDKSIPSPKSVLSNQNNKNPFTIASIVTVIALLLVGGSFYYAYGKKKTIQVNTVTSASPILSLSISNKSNKICSSKGQQPVQMECKCSVQEVKVQPYNPASEGYETFCEGKILSRVCYTLNNITANSEERIDLNCDDYEFYVGGYRKLK